MRFKGAEAYKVDSKIIIYSINIIYSNYYPKVRPSSELSQRSVKPN